MRKLKWHKGQARWACKTWAADDVIGLAANLSLGKVQHTSHDLARSRATSPDLLPSPPISPHLTSPHPIVISQSRRRLRSRATEIGRSAAAVSSSRTGRSRRECALITSLIFAPLPPPPPLPCPYYPSPPPPPPLTPPPPLIATPSPPLPPPPPSPSPPPSLSLSLSLSLFFFFSRFRL